MDEKTLKTRFPNAKGSYPEFKICCNQCDDKRFRLGFNVLKEVGHCFNCGYRIGPHKFKEFLGQEFGDYSKNDIDSVISMINEENIRLQGITPWDKKLEFPGIKMTLAPGQKNPYYLALFERACTYLEDRGFYALGVADHYGLILPEEGFFSTPRLVIPTFEKGRMVFYQARALGDSMPKYLNPPKKLGPVGKNNFVFNLDRVDPSQDLIICEGVFSAMAAGPQAVAVFGKEISATQRLKILGCGAKRATILFDPGAMSSALKAGNSLRGALEIRVANLELGDPNEVSASYLADILASAVLLEENDLLAL